MKSKQQLRLEAFARFSITPYTEWASLRSKRNLPNTKEDYEAYVDRKYEERENLDNRIKAY